jgi:hypothetical protein
MHVDTSDIYPSALVFYTRHRVNIMIYRTVYLHTDMCLQTLTHIQFAIWFEVWQIIITAFTFFSFWLSVAIYVCAVFSFPYNYLKDIYSMSHFYFCLPWLLESSIPVIFICTPPPFSFWNITVLWSNSNTTHIVITHSCDLQQKNDVSVNLLNGPGRQK